MNSIMIITRVPAPWVFRETNRQGSHFVPVQKFRDFSSIFTFFPDFFLTSQKYQVVKVSPGGSHLGANWKRAGSELEWGERDECYTRF